MQCFEVEQEHDRRMVESESCKSKSLISNYKSVKTVLKSRLGYYKSENLRHSVIADCR